MYWVAIEEHIFKQQVEAKVFTNWLKEIKEKGMLVEESAEELEAGVDEWILVSPE